MENSPRGTVLIVDDSAMMRKIVLRMLGLADLHFDHILEAANGREGLELLKSNPVDLILCDITMPVMSGLEMLRQVQALGLAKNVPVVMITTEGCAEHVTAALALGATTFVRKPFTADEVKRKVCPLVAKAA